MEGLLVLGAMAIRRILVMWWRCDRSNARLHQWAASNGHHVVRQEYRHLRKGPFFWTSSKGQSVHYVIVEDSNGSRRSGWVRCGGWWLGLLSDHVEARWET